MPALGAGDEAAYETKRSRLTRLMEVRKIRVRVPAGVADPKGGHRGIERLFPILQL
jgi:hypothetical protein